MNMLQVIQRGAAHSAQRTLLCPFCGGAPPLAARIAESFVVGCDSEDCAANPQVSGATVGEAWERWNRRPGAG